LGGEPAEPLELARVLSRRSPLFTYWLVFFDGEEAIERWSTSDSLYGSRHFVETLLGSGKLGGVQAMVLLGCKGGPNCPPPGKTSLLDLPTALEVGQADHAALLTGPLAAASTLAEDLLLEYANDMRGKDLGWGRLRPRRRLAPRRRRAPQRHRKPPRQFAFRPRPRLGRRNRAGAPTKLATRSRFFS